MDPEKFETLLVENGEMPPQFFYDLLAKALNPEISVAEPVLDVIKISNIPPEDLERIIKIVRDSGGRIIEDK